MGNKIKTIILLKNAQMQQLVKQYLDELEGFDCLEIDSQMAFGKFPENSFFIVETDNDIKIINEINRFAKSPKVLVLDENFSVNFLVKLLRLGVSEYLSLPIIKSEFTEAIQRIKSSYTEEKPKEVCGKVISMYSDKGGVGKTSVACNFAVELEKCTKEKVALVDLDFQSGDVATFLGLNPTCSIMDMIRNSDKNFEYILNLTERYNNTNLYIYTNNAGWEVNEKISSKEIINFINILKQHFSYIVIDNKCQINKNDFSIIEESDIVLLLTEASLPALKNAQRSLELLTYGGMSDRVKIVLNRYMENDEISINDIEKLLNKKIFWKIPNNYFTIMSAINKGVPVCDESPNSNIARNYAEFAQCLIEEIYRKFIIRR